LFFLTELCRSSHAAPVVLSFHSFFDFSLAPGEEELRRRISARWKIVADP
jgi:hypothetical protein